MPLNDNLRVAIVMSRMPRLINPQATWLDGLRASLRRVADHQQTLLISPGTAGSDFVRRGAERIGVVTQRVGDDDETADGSSRDRQFTEQAAELLVLAVRSRGNIHQLLADRLHRGVGPVTLIDLPGLQPPAVRQDLISRGAMLWTPDASTLRPFVTMTGLQPRGARNSAATPSSSVLSLEPLSRADLNSYLTHTTRACPGPWPGQMLDHYLDSLLDASACADHSALHTLRRILQQQRLIGSGRTIRGGYPVVSFTAASVDELPGLRCFQTHRARWDFEPFAVCIRRDVLEARGVRPAVYGGERLWTGLADFQRPFFQLGGESSAAAAGTRLQDWSREREWRHLGDLDLTDFARDEIIVLVPTTEAARVLQPCCPWPLSLWPGATPQSA